MFEVRSFFNIHRKDGIMWVNCCDFCELSNNKEHVCFELRAVQQLQSKKSLVKIKLEIDGVKVSKKNYLCAST